MLYLEDFLECIEHLPQDLRDRFTEMRESDLKVQNSLDRLEERSKCFFADCKKNKQKEWRDSEFEKLKGEYDKVVEEADDKVQLGNHIYDLVERYVRRLDQELLKYKMELEADNAGITEQLEQKCLKEMAASQQASSLNHKNDRRKDGSRRKGRVADTQGISTIAASSLIPSTVSCFDMDSSRASSPGLPSDSTEPSGSRPSSRNFSSAPHQLASALNLVAASETNGSMPITGPETKKIETGSSSAHQLNYNTFGVSNPAIAAAASQAIAATTHMQQGRRTSSLKASYEALRRAEDLAKDLVFGNVPGSCSTGSTNAYGPNAFVTETAKPPKPKKIRPNSSHPSDGNLHISLGVTHSSGSNDLFRNNMDDFFVGEDESTRGVDLVGETELQPVESGDWAYDPNEDTQRYCICNQVSYGEMVGCDNNECPIEWFHYGCVGLTHAPKGKWFCPQCTANMKRKKR